MIFKGHDLRYRYDLTFRLAREGDVDLNGDDIAKTANCVFTTVHRCLNEAGKFSQDLLLTAKPIPVVYSRTNLGYGKLRENERGMYFMNHRMDAIEHPEQPGILIEPGEEFFVRRYWSRPVYAALDGRVYTGSVYYWEKPKLYEGDPK